ncbi:Imm50 family immunity protein [Streptomyces niveiscabiei]|uniref:Imm50 family immunity protein n=1 Tax=Streptomyces niveiscabiei TaxID=164115 RepID=UPI0029B73C69|nr:Imm50 family immunity protein [Streptomyces niveiscabiei]MDX3385738.1 Imm50 family immunity protein [Streptomyces niveiscabiei]
MTVDEFIANSQVLGSLYEDSPVLGGDLRLRSVNLSWIGPTVTLRVDLAGFPVSVPKEWRDAGLDTVQCQLRFLDVDHMVVKGWSPLILARVNVVGRLEEGRIQVDARSEKSGFALSFECSDSVLVGRVSAFKVRGDGMDDGSRIHVRRLDSRLYGTLPDTFEKVYYERF